MTTLPALTLFLLATVRPIQSLAGAAEWVVYKKVYDCNKFQSLRKRERERESEDLTSPPPEKPLWIGEMEKSAHTHTSECDTHAQRVRGGKSECECWFGRSYDNEWKHDMSELRGRLTHQTQPRNDAFTASYHLTTLLWTLFVAEEKKNRA